jgi:hypothetical protein
MHWQQLVEGIETILESSDAPGTFPRVVSRLRRIDLPSTVSLKHRTLQLALVFACGVGQLSPGAYLLRRDLFPVIVMVRWTRFGYATRELRGRF